MNQIQKQSILNTLFQYFGIALGFLNVVILFPRVLSSTQIGLTNLLFAVALVYSNFSALGMNRTLIRFFPFFRSKDNKHNGLFSIALLIPLVGFIILSLLYYIFQVEIIGFYKAKSDMFVEYYFYAVPLTFFLLYLSILESYLQVLLRTVISNFFRNIFVRFVKFLGVIAFYFELISFNMFINIYILSYLFAVLFLILIIFRSGKYTFTISWKYLKKRVLKLVFVYGGFAILSGMSMAIVSNIDQLMIGSYLGLSEIAIYGIALYMCNVIYVPGQAVGRITFPIISSFWKKKQFEKIKLIYTKSSITQLLTGSLILLGIWVNIEALFSFLPDEYAAGKHVVLFIGLARLFDMATGTNGQIILASKYYRFDTLATLFLVVLTVVTNYAFIPKYGINGAAIATAITIVLYNTIKLIFIHQKMKMHPFSSKTGIAILLIGFLFGVFELLPHLSNIYLDLIIRSSLLSLLFITAIRRFKLSEDLNNLIDRLLKLLPIKN